jgi:hypothetical protein
MLVHPVGSTYSRLFSSSRWWWQVDSDGAGGGGGGGGYRESVQNYGQQVH